MKEATEQESLGLGAKARAKGGHVGIKDADDIKALRLDETTTDMSKESGRRRREGRPVRGVGRGCEGERGWSEVRPVPHTPV